MIWGGPSDAVAQGSQTVAGWALQLRLQLQIGHSRCLIGFTDLTSPRSEVKNECRVGVRTLMSTGDYHHTALAVARGVGMVPPQGQGIIIQARSEMSVAVGGSRASALKPDKPAQQSSPAVPTTRSVAFADQLCTSGCSTEDEGLVFQADEGGATQADPVHTLTAIAQVNHC